MSDRSTTVWFVLSAFLVHAVLGCCVHHTHVLQASPIPVAFLAGFADTEARASQPAHGYGDICCDDPCHRPGAPEQECDEGTCTFDVSRNAVLPMCLWVTALANVAPKDAVCSLWQSTTHVVCNYPLGGRSAIHACQLLQTWLL